MYNIKLLNKISNVGLAKFDTKEFAYADAVSYTHLTLPTISHV